MDSHRGGDGVSGRRAVASLRGFVNHRLASIVAAVRADLAFATLDMGLTVLAYLIARYVIQDESWHKRPAELVGWFAIVLAVNLAANISFGLYGRMWRHASVDEARRVIAAGISAGLFLVIAWYVIFQRPPIRLIVLGMFLTILLVGAIRFRSRLFAFQREPDHQAGLRVAVIGSRDMAAAIIRDMHRNPGSGLVPVIAVDDDRAVRGRSVSGVPVVGTLDDLPRRIRDFGIHMVLLAVSSPTPELLRRAAAAAHKAEVPIRILPSMRDLVRGEPSLRDARDLRIEDLIGRPPVSTDLAGVSRLLSGRRVLITGGGGSIGAEIARQVAQHDPAQLVLLDHDETHLHDACADLPIPADQVLADIRDPHGMMAIFEELKPEIVFHAAAHKHVPILERFPLEAARTNVLGTANVVDAAAAAATERLVFISTDKAVRPASMLGASKWLGEQIVLERCPPGAAYCSVRFGNVLGSRGSVIPTFSRQIVAGGPITVTDPTMTRFFMSITEAVQLVLQAAVEAKGGDLFMLDMGEPVNIMELARRMIHLSGRRVGVDIEIEVTGRRPGEKQLEELRMPEEVVIDEPHLSIHRLRSCRLDPDELNATVAMLNDAADSTSNADAAACLGLYIRDTQRHEVPEPALSDEELLPALAYSSPPLTVRTAPAT